MSVGTAIKGKVLSIVINKVKDSEPTTSLLGVILGGVVGAKIDYSLLLQGDAQQIGNAVAAVVIVLIGWFTNHKKKTEEKQG